MANNGRRRFRVCEVCGDEKQVGDFARNDTVCRKCRGIERRIREENQRQEETLSIPWQERVNRRALREREAMLKSLYGITLDDFNRLLKAQRYRCAICRKKVPNLFVDHSHLTGRIRGLLCSSCNFGLGHFFDDPKLLRQAIQYLRDHGEE